MYNFSKVYSNGYINLSSQSVFEKIICNEIIKNLFIAWFVTLWNYSIIWRMTCCSIYIFFLFSLKIFIMDAVIMGGGEGGDVATDRRISKFACRRTQILIKQYRRPQMPYLPELQIYKKRMSKFAD